MVEPGQEPLDTLGGIAFGKPRGRDAKALTEEQRKKYADIQTFNVLYCTVSIKGVTHTGEAAEATDVPAEFRLKGVNFMPINDTLRKFEQKRLLPWTVPLDLGLKRDKNGSVTFYHVLYNYDPTVILPNTVETMENVKTFVAVVGEHNSRVLGEHKAAHKGDRRASSTAADDRGSTLDDDLVDEIHGGEDAA
jgi:hypothetical protein